MTEPNGQKVKQLEAEIEAMKKQFADFIASQGALNPKEWEKLESQASLDAKYAENRKRFNEQMLPDAEFRALSRGKASGDSEDLVALIKEQRSLIKAQGERIETLETLVLETQEPKAPKK